MKTVIYFTLGLILAYVINHNVNKYLSYKALDVEYKVKVLESELKGCYTDLSIKRYEFKQCKLLLN